MDQHEQPNEQATNPEGGMNSFRIEFNCQKKGLHYCKLIKGSGKSRTTSMGGYIYLGKAELVASQRGGFYANRWRQYQSRHDCKGKAQATN